MSIQWLISKDDAAPILLETLGVSSCHVNLAANGEDTMSFVVDDDYTADPAFPKKTKVALIRRDGATDVCCFVGWIRSIPRIASAEQEDIAYTAEGPSSLLGRVTYAQQWTVITADDGTPAMALEPRVILGENNAGARRSTGQQITDIIEYAVSQGIPIAAGTINVGLTAPRDERENISCFEAILSLLRWTPTQVLSWDYNNVDAGAYVPAANVTAAADMTAVNAALHNSDVTSAAFTPRYDLQVPGIVVTYRIAGEVDGKPYERRAYDTAGDADDPERMSFYFDMEGASYESMRQDVVTGTYPTTYAAAQAWLASIVPWLAALPAGSWNSTGMVRSGTHNYLRYLVEGSICEWMGLGVERETLTVKVRILTKDSDGNVTEDSTRDVPITLISTSATTRSYTKNFLTGTSETIPSGLADAIYAEWSRLQWDGNFSIDEAEPTFAIRPGVVLNWTGARSEWATMAAVVQSVAIDINSGASYITTGPCARLEADSRLAMFRAVRSRRLPTLTTRGDGAVDALSGPESIPDQDTFPAQPDKHHRLTVRAPDGDSRNHSVDLDPSAVSFANSTDASPQTITPREVTFTDADGKTHKRQILSGSPYGEDDPGDPDVPTPPPCGHPGNQPGGGSGTPDDDPTAVDNDHPGDTPGGGGAGGVDHPGDAEGDNGVTPESSGDCT